MVENFEKQAAVVILGAGPNQVPLIRKAREMGYTVISVDRDTEAPGMQYSDIVLELSTHDADGVIGELEKTGDTHRLQGVLARTTGQALYTASLICRIFSLPGINDTIAKISTEKASLREFLADHGIPVPTGKKVSPEEPWKQDIPFPVIVKPDFTLTGKKDVYLVRDEHSFDRYVDSAARSSGNQYAEIEQFVEGIDVSCMFFANKGKAEVIAYWDELVAIMGDGTVSGLGISTPSVTHDTVAEENMRKIVRKFASLFPDVAAILVISFRVDPKGAPHVIELHADLTGDLILDVLLPASSEEFDPWAMILDCGTEGIMRYGDLKWLPTTLYYSGRKADSLREQGLIQKPSLKMNLETFSTIMVTTDQDVAYPPEHLEWLLKYTDDKQGPA